MTRKNDLIFRIENTEGRGPYYNEQSIITHNMYSLHSSKVRPGPRGDIRLKPHVTPEQYYGFESLQDLRKWFTLKDIRNFKKHDYHLKIFSVNKRECHKGNKQVMFKRHKAKIMASLSLNLVEKKDNLKVIEKSIRDIV